MSLQLHLGRTSFRLAGALAAATMLIGISLGISPGFAHTIVGNRVVSGDAHHRRSRRQRRIGVAGLCLYAGRDQSRRNTRAELL